MAAFDPKTASLADLAHWTGGAQPGSINHTIGMAEFTKRQTEWQIKAAEAQIAAARAEKLAANAAVDTATSTKANARYTLWAAIAAAIAAGASLFTIVLPLWK